MRKVSSWIAAAAVCGTAMFGATNANAAMVYNIVGSFSGGQLGAVSFDVTISGDFSADINDTSTGLTINTLTRNAAPFTPAGGLGYRYNNVLDRLIIGGFMTGINGISGLTSDFMYAIYGFTNTPNALQASDSIETVAGFTHPAIGPLQLTAVPLPAAFYMFGTAIAGLFGVGWRRRMAST